jgi:Planctomycete cytochrome C
MRQRVTIHFWVMLSFLGLWITACNFREDKAGRITAVRGNYFDFISQNIFKPKCMKCHSGPGSPGGMDLTSYDAIMNSGKLVAKDPDSSKLYLTLKAGKMPPSGPLSDQEIQMVFDWIKMGAPRTGGAPTNSAPPIAPVPPDPDPTPTFAYINKYVFQKQGCVGCHSGTGTGTSNGTTFTKPAGDLDLTTYDNLMDAVHVVRPGNGDLSKLWLRLDDNSMPPKPLPPVSQKQKDAVHLWIDNGADRIP